MLGLFFLTWLGVVAAQIAPGPNLMAVASVALSRGRKPALFVVGGIASGMLVWSAATAFGLGTLIETFPLALFIMKLAGGGYLIFLAVKALRALRQNNADARITATNDEMSAYAAWRRGVFVLLTNPKAALMWAAVASFLLGHEMSAWQVLAFGPVGAVSGLVVYGAYAFIFSAGIAKNGYIRFSRSFELVFATAFGAMGASLIWSGLTQSTG